MAKKKNQHFVPQIYLRSFSTDGKSIGLLIKNSQKIVPSAPIKNQSSRDYFYGKDLLIEDTFSDIEGVLGTVLNKLNTTGISSLNPIDINFLYQYTFLQFGRTEDMANELVNNASLMKEHFKGIFPELNAPDFESIDDYQSNVRLAIMVMADVFHRCKDLRYMFLVNSTKYDFISSDNPVCLYNQFHERIGKRTFAFGSIGAQIIFPLTPRIMLLLYDSLCYKIGHRKSTSIDITSSDDVANLNNIVYINADKVIYFRDSKALSSFHRVLDIDSSKSSYTQFTYKDSGLFHSANQPPICKAKLSFIRETDRTKHIKQYSIAEGPLLRNVFR